MYPFQLRLSNNVKTYLAIYHKTISHCILQFLKGAFSCPSKFVATESPVKIMKNAFFHL